MELETFLLFVATSGIVVLSPGATAVLVATQGARNGLHSTLFCIFGIMLATSVYFMLAATGLASLMLTSHMAFQLIKWAGVGYLVYLGVGAILSKSSGFALRSNAKKQSKLGMFWQGFMIEFAIPKAMLIFAALLPQFLDIAAPVLPQMLIMGTTGMVIQLAVYSCYAKLGAALAPSNANSSLATLANKLAGAALIFAAVKMAGVER